MVHAVPDWTNWLKPFNANQTIAGIQRATFTTVNENTEEDIKEVRNPQSRTYSVSLVSHGGRTV